MNYFKESTVSRGDFRRALSLRCLNEFGSTLNDLPDIINIDDNWWPGMSEKEALVMIESCIDEFKDEFGLNKSNEAPIYSIDE
jgi:hypothetical protein